jgi:hypothetical protein
MFRISQLSEQEHTPFVALSPHILSFHILSLPEVINLLLYLSTALIIFPCAPICFQCQSNKLVMTLNVLENKFFLSVVLLISPLFVRMAKLLARSIIIKLFSQKPQTLSTDLSPVGRDPLLYAANLHSVTPHILIWKGARYDTVRLCGNRVTQQYFMFRLSRFLAINLLLQGRAPLFTAQHCVGFNVSRGYSVTRTVETAVCCISASYCEKIFQSLKKILFRFKGTEHIQAKI